MRALLIAASLALGLSACATPPTLRGTGDLGVVIERAAGRVQVVEHSQRTALGTVDGLGDLSHAHVTFSRDGRYAYVFGRDGGLTKVDLLTRRIDRRVIHSRSNLTKSLAFEVHGWEVLREIGIAINPALSLLRSAGPR